MQETQKMSNSHGKHKQETVKVPLDARQKQGALESTDALETSGDFETTSVLWKQDSNKTADTPQPHHAHETPQSVDRYLEPHQPFETPDSEQTADELELTHSDETQDFDAKQDFDEMSESTDAHDAQTVQNALEVSDSAATQQSPWMRDSATPPVSLKTPLLAAAAVVSLLAAGWNYSTLEETRAQLTVVSEAKASVDKALAEAQGRLAAAEKAVAEVKAALTLSPAAAVPKKSATAAEPPAPAKDKTQPQ